MDLVLEYFTSVKLFLLCKPPSLPFYRTKEETVLTEQGIWILLNPQSYYRKWDVIKSTSNMLAVLFREDKKTMSMNFLGIINALGNILHVFLVCVGYTFY